MFNLHGINNHLVSSVTNAWSFFGLFRILNPPRLYFFFCNCTVGWSVHENDSLNVSVIFCINWLDIKFISVGMLVPFLGSLWHYVFWDTKPVVISSVAWAMWVLKMGQYLLLCYWGEHENDCFPIFTTWLLLVVLMWNDPEELKFSTVLVFQRKVHYLQNCMEQYEAKCVIDNKAPSLKCVCLCVWESIIPLTGTYNQCSLTHVIQNFLFLDFPEAKCW